MKQTLNKVPVSTHFLRAALAAIGLAVLAICVFLLPAGIKTDTVGGYRYILLGMYVTVIPFYLALLEGFKLLNYIDDNKAFSELSVKALNNIKWNASAISMLYLLGLPYIYTVAERDDAPGVILIALILIGAPLVVAVGSAVLQKLLKNAIDLKKENDLTV